MRGRRRAVAAIIVALLCAPAIWLRSDITWTPPETITLERIAGESETSFPAWMVSGVWHYSADSLLFGGFSALLALPEDQLLSFSDRGARFSLGEPDAGDPGRKVEQQRLASVNYLADIEAAAIDPATGAYWLALENNHGVHRFSQAHAAKGVRALDADALDWSNNTGAEAMTRLADGRFVIIPEGRRTGVIYAGDPIEASDYTTFDYLPPVPGHATTDMAQLPDGRVLLLLRNLDPAGGIPPFESKIAIAPAPRTGQAEPWAPEVTLDLAGVVPRENYEGMAVREMDDGRVAVWLISDDNLSLIQRTLLAKLILDPDAL